MSQQSGTHIFIGPWINWNHGAVVGSTLTLSSRDGGLLTAFLAIFVSVAGAALWRILSYFLHQIRAKRGYQDGLHHQQQLILRNTSGAGGASWQFAQLVPFWWKSAEKPLRRSVPLFFLALLNLSLFGLAGLFSSEVTKATGNETLIRSPNCGFWSVNDGTSATSSTAFNFKALNDTITAASYARSCYGATQDLLQCEQYTKSQIKWTSNRNASCPFGGDICRIGPTSAYEMDTGPIDSHIVLGINTRPADRITYRKVTTCSPLRAKGYMTLWNDTDSDHVAYGDLFQRFWYGPIANVSDYTYQYNTHASVDNYGYALTSLMQTVGVGPSAWEANANLSRSDADTSLFLLAPNGISYAQPVADPFFSANTPYVMPNPVDNGTTKFTYYSSDVYVHVLGCIDQHQFCNPINNQCTPLTAYWLAYKGFAKLGFSPMQTEVASRLSRNLMFMNMYYSVSGRGSSALRAAETVYELVQQGSLPDDQWTLEVSSWFAVGMAKLQQAVVAYAAGPTDVHDGSYIYPPANANEEAMCNAQKVRSSAGTMSFSVLGVAIILIVGALLIFTNLVFETVFGFVQRKIGTGDYKRLQWILDEKMQMQRLAYEGAGQGRWRGGANTVPVTAYGDLFGIPDQVDKKHPRLDIRRGSPGGGPTEGDGLMEPDKLGYTTRVVEV